MDIEIVEFYKISEDEKRQRLSGTIHAYLCDLDIDLRGVHICKEKNFWFVTLPFRRGTDEEGKEVRYPIFSFANGEKQKTLIETLREKGKDYILCQKDNSGCMTPFKHQKGI